jgi:hypothetical protein
MMKEALKVCANRSTHRYYGRSSKAPMPVYVDGGASNNYYSMEDTMEDITEAVMAEEAGFGDDGGGGGDGGGGDGGGGGGGGGA